MPAEQKHIADARRICILVVDDKPLVAAIMADILGLEGMRSRRPRMAVRPWRRSPPAHTMPS